MCGIAGFAGQGSEDDLRRMCAALRHRGPDAADIWLDSQGGIGFAHARLSVLDHAGGAQPMWTSDARMGIVFNGEIYNFAQLRKELTALGGNWASGHSDTEVVLQGYRIWGPDVVSRLNGMWAFVILDREQNCLFASRDRFGKKPMYYQHRLNQLIFASELTALEQHPHCDRTPDTLAIKKYYAYGYIPAPRTQYLNVRKLPAGHNMVFDLGSGKLELYRYWRMKIEPLAIDPVPAQERLLTLLDRAVSRRLVADVPVGLFLSGGLDSSVVSALAARHLERGRLKTFSIGFDEASFDESAHARRVAAHIGSDHHECILRVDDILPLIDTIARRMDEPQADSSLLPTYLVSRLAREQVTVALGGDGADELFAGYAPFKALRWGRLLHSTSPQAGLQALSWLIGHLPVSHDYMSLDFKLKRTLSGLLKPPEFWIPAWMAPLDVDAVNTLVNDGVVHTRDEIYSEVLDSWAACDEEDMPSKALQFFTDLYLQDGILTKVDRASMMNALEVRAPFLDIEVADFARRLPTHMKLRGGQTKWLLKQAALSLLPHDVVHRPKQGFAVPVGRWFRDGALELEPDRLPAYIDRKEVQARLAGHRRGAADERLFLWATLMLGKMSRS